MEGNVGVEGESLRAPRMDADNGFAMAPEQPAGRAFPKEMPKEIPRLLLGLSAKINLDRDAPANQLLSSDLIFLPNSSNGAPAGGYTVMNEKRSGSPDLQHWLRKSTAGLDPVEKSGRVRVSFPSAAG